MDELIGTIGIVMRFPFAAVAAALIGVYAILLFVFLLIVWVILAPLLWLLLIPFRLFTVPRKGGAEKLRRDLSRDINGWKADIKRLASTPMGTFTDLAHWWLGNKP